MNRSLSTARSLGALVVAVALAGAGCPKDRPGALGDVDQLLEPCRAGTGLVFEADREREPQAMAALANMVHKRLEAFGLHGLVVDAIGFRGIRVCGPIPSAELAARVEQLVTRPVSMAIAPVDPGRDYFERLRERLPAQSGVRIGQDQVGDLQHGKLGRFWYLAADDPSELHRLLVGQTPPPGRRLAVLEGSGGAMALLLPEPAPIVNPVLTRVRLVDDDSAGGLAVAAELAQPFRGPFNDLVRANLHRPLAFVVDGAVVALPVVGTRTLRGELRIQPSPLADDPALRAQAERLAVKLKAWQLVGELRLISSRTNP